ncbi:uncharacterized protein LOC115227611 [Argonauta hians]
MASSCDGHGKNGPPSGPKQDDDDDDDDNDGSGGQAQSSRSSPYGEYLAATERINSGLHKLRLELSEIRDQDVQLLKQLIQISETIKKLSDDRLRKRRTWYGQRQSMCSESSDIFIDVASLSPDLDEYREAVLFRQFSEPTSFSRDIYLDPTTTTAIFDASRYLTYGNLGNHSRDTQQQQQQQQQQQHNNWGLGLELLKVPFRHSRPHSVSIVSEKPYSMESSQEWQCQNDDNSYEELLERSVRLWKNKHFDGHSGSQSGAGQSGGVGGGVGGVVGGGVGGHDDDNKKLISLINEYLKNERSPEINTD